MYPIQDYKRGNRCNYHTPPTQIADFGRMQDQLHSQMEGNMLLEG